MSRTTGGMLLLAGMALVACGGGTTDSSEPTAAAGQEVCDAVPADDLAPLLSAAGPGTPVSTSAGVVGCTWGGAPKGVVGVAVFDDQGAVPPSKGATDKVASLLNLDLAGFSTVSLRTVTGSGKPVAVLVATNNAGPSVDAVVASVLDDIAPLSGSSPG